MENRDVSQLTHRAEIIAKLTQLKDTKCPLLVHFMNLGTLSTNILAIDSEIGELFLECGDDNQLNQKLVRSLAVEFHALFDFTKVSFISKKITQITLDNGKSAFLLEIPKTLIWSNRRKYDRKTLPKRSESFCEIVFPLPSADSSPEYQTKYPAIAEKVFIFPLYDVSFSGCSIINHDKTLKPLFVPKMVFKKCKILNPNSNEIRISFELMTTRLLENDNEEFGELIGIRFLNVKRKLILR